MSTQKTELADALWESILAMGVAREFFETMSPKFLVGERMVAQSVCEKLGSNAVRLSVILANADFDLLEAAPELLAALKEILAVRWIDASVCQARSNLKIAMPNDITSGDKSLVIAADIAHAAIAKVENKP